MKLQRVAVLDESARGDGSWLYVLNVGEPRSGERPVTQLEDRTAIYGYESIQLLDRGGVLLRKAGNETFYPEHSIVWGDSLKAL